jgi:hypothetical protein
MAALTLVRFFVGLPVGALCGGWLTRRLPASFVTALGMLLSAGGFTWMSRWPFDALSSGTATIPLFTAGFGVGLAMAPVNAAMLSATPPPVHGLSSALLVVARPGGKLVGLSVLTSIGVHQYYAARAGVPPPAEVCGAGESRCPELNRLLQEAALVELHTVFLGAAVCCVLAAIVGLVVLRGARTTEMPRSAGLLS